MADACAARILPMSGRELIQMSAPISLASPGGLILNSQAQVIAVAHGILEEVRTSISRYQSGCPELAQRARPPDPILLKNAAERSAGTVGPIPV
jgi:hypothetical protein